MAFYLLQVAYTPEAWAVQLHNPLDRREAVSSVVERLGGYIESAYYAFGDYDAILILEMPDNVSAAAFSLAVSAGKAVKAVKTTPLLTIEGGIAAMQQTRPRPTLLVNSRRLIANAIGGSFPGNAHGLSGLKRRMQGCFSAPL